MRHLKKGFALKFKTALICRGEGKVFFHLIAGNKSSFTDTIFHAESDKCTHLPITTYAYQSNDFSIREVILTIPLLNFKKIKLTAQQNDIAYSQIYTYREIIAQSKLAYSLRKAHADSVRKTASSMPINGTIIDLVSFSQIKEKFPNEYLIKGTITIPNNSSTLSLYVTDNTGNNAAEIPCSFVQSFTKNSIPTNVFSFTFRFTDNIKNGCIVASCENKSVQNAFFSLDSANIQESLEKYSTEGYSCAKPGHYDSFREKAAAHKRIVSLNTTINYDNSFLFSIIVPVYNTPLQFLKEMIQSVINQTYQKWELILVNASPNNNEVNNQLKTYLDPRIKVINLESNLGIANNTNQGIKEAKGDYVCFLDHDDTLAPEALLFYWKHSSKNPQAEVLYCDEDLLDESGNYINPNFKPDFSLDLLRVHNYITHFLVVKKSLLDKYPLDYHFDGAQDYDLILKLSESTKKIIHIPEVLYHWRISDASTAKNSSSKTYAIEAGKNALKAHLERCNIDADVATTNIPFFYHATYKIKGNPLVSIIIPNKDHTDILKKCLESIQNKTSYPNFEIIVIENNSTEHTTFDYYRTIQNIWNNVSIVTWTDMFNYSKINNYGVQFAKGEFIILLNNDTEVINPSWIESLLGYCQQNEVGAVGGKLLYPDNTIQHAGIKIYECKTPAESGGPVHIFQHLDNSDPGYMRRLDNPHNVSAITGACLMTRKSTYEQLEGLDERFAVAYNDVDYCLKLRSHNYRIVFNPEVLLYHHESISRGLDTDSSGLDNYARFLSEQGLFRQKWSKVLAKKDPFHTFG